MFEDIFQSITVTTVLVSLVVLLVVHSLTKRLSDIPPSPMPVLPVFGNLLHLLTNKDVLEYFRKLREKYGDIFSIYMGSQLMIVINGYSAIRETLVQNGRMFSDRPKNYLTQDLNEDSGVIFTSGEKWKEHRRFAMNALQESGIRRSSFEHNILEEASELLHVIEEQKGKPFDMKGIVNTCAANVISQMVFGKRFKHSEANFTEFFDKLELTAKLLGNTSVLVNCFPILQYLPGDPMKMRLLKQNQKIYEKWYGEMYNEHKSTHNKKSACDYIDLYISKARHLTKDGKSSTFTDKQLCSVIRDLFAAGSETTVTSIRWASLHFLHFPEIQRKCFEELDRVVGRDRLPTLKDKKHLPYLEATILEVMRVYPVAPLSLPHAVSQDVIFRGYHVPKGTTIIINLHSVLYDPSTFKDPEQFRPERFLDVDGCLRKPENHIPFSIGRRACLGESVARMELFLLLAALIQNFEFLPVEGEQLPDIKGILGITYSPKPFLLRAVKRK